MPQLYNGCGTWYIRKSNLTQFTGLCQACKRTAVLKTYTTRLWVLIAMIPVIPLGRKRILDECSLCKRHRVMPQSEWERVEHRAQELMAACRAAPSDPEPAKTVLNAVAAYRNLPAFDEIAPEIEHNLAWDAKVLCLLAAINDLFGRLPESERITRLALGLKDEDPIRETLADYILRQGRPDEAQPYIDHIVAKGIPDRVDLLYALAQGYQLKGEHEKALLAFSQCEQVNPGIVRDETFTRLREASAKNLGKRTVVKPSEIVRKAKNKATARRTLKIAAIVVVVALAGYLTLAAIEGQRHMVFLVSGVDRPYTARINGKSYALQPLAVIPIHIAEGPVKVELVDPNWTLPPETINVETPILARPFFERVFVINPDGAAVLRRIKVYYADKSQGNAPRGEVTHVGGQTLLALDGIDYPFQIFPDTVELSSSSAVESRVALLTSDRQTQVSPLYMLMGLTKELGAPAVVRMAQRQLMLQPEREDLLTPVEILMQPKDRAALLQTGLSARPLRMSWHRAYQNALNSLGENSRVVKEYDALLAADPGNKNLIYLAARARRDNDDKALAMFREAATGESPSGYACYALFRRSLSNGEFHEAARYADQVTSLLPNVTEFRGATRLAYLADGQNDKVLKIARTNQSSTYEYWPIGYSDEVYVHTMAGQNGAALDTIDRYRKTLAHETNEQIHAMIDPLLAEMDYYSGQPGKGNKNLEKSVSPEEQYVADVRQGNLKALDKDIPAESRTWDLHLLAYLTAAQEGRFQEAESYYQAAAKVAVESDGAEDHAIGSVLKGHPDAPLNLLLDSLELPRSKAILLTAYGLRNPDARQVCFVLARKLNFDKRFPYLLIKQILNAPPQIPATQPQSRGGSTGGGSTGGGVSPLTRVPPVSVQSKWIPGPLVTAGG